ncbi:class I lanthipeptide [Chitinophaga solisilvae]|uniref:Class I lanthipeptide n=1 Tax=Chitinophaga solisilvae TaxID=1233460 RepID=A0A9Q5D1F5_9BACT|nr:class I lanthipeptide [Chitinophaga solisilvae]NSL86304.1 hypothetical protein [Chitinophaga solisilvae]
MKKIASKKKLQLNTIKVTTLTPVQQNDVKGGAASILCTRFVSCGRETCLC